MAGAATPDAADEASAATLAFEAALALHQAGGLAEAAVAYEALLRDAPRHAPSLHLLGLVRLQQGDAAAAQRLIESAIGVDPAHAGLRASHARVLQSLGEPARAMDAIAQALALAPDRRDLLVQRAALAQAHGDATAAERDLRRVVAVAPDWAEGWHQLGVLLLGAGDASGAQTLLARAVALAPQVAASRRQLGVALARLARPHEALAQYDDALALDAAHAETWSNRAAVLSTIGDNASAIASARRARELAPKWAVGWANEGAALLALQRPGDALTAIDQALALSPADVAAGCNRVRALQALRRLPEALAAARALTRAHPQDVRVWSQCAGLGVALRRWPEAIEACEAVLRLDPRHSFIEGRRLHALGKLCRWDGWDQRVQRHGQAVAAGRPVAEPFGLLALVDDPALQRQAARLWVQRFEVDAQQRVRLPPSAQRRTKRLRIGWFSEHFRTHPTAQLLAGVFEVFDRDRFESIALSLTPPSDDPMQRRLRGSFDGWLELHDLDDAAAANAIAQAGVELLVDLGGLTRGARPGVLARRPALVQLAFLAYTGTTALSTIDALLADAVVIPPEQETHCSETVVKLPGSLWPHDHRMAVARQVPSRTDLGLPEQGFVFCCFCDAAKLNPPLFTVWMRLLQARPDAVLWLLAGHEEVPQNLRHEAALRGVDPARIVFATRLPLDAHLARHAAADLFLDTAPFNGHTTVSDALWAGLPVLTLEGRSFAARVASSQLQALGLHDFVARSPAAYEHRALALAGDPQRLAAVRAQLQARRAAHGPEATRAYARGLEAAFARLITDQRAC